MPIIRQKHNGVGRDRTDDLLIMKTEVNFSQTRSQTTPQPHLSMAFDSSRGYGGAL